MFTCSFSKNKLYNSNFKSFASNITHPKSLVFHHKKDMDRFHKLITRMKKPSTVDGKLSCKQLFEEFDVDPGLTY